MNCIEHLDKIARRLLRIIENQRDAVPIPTPDYGWENHRFRSPKFRLAHVEIFQQQKFCVVHCCIFPNTTDPSPIYGFDAIAGENKVTGVFMDLSPTVDETKPFLQINPKNQRSRPDWGSIFSPHWLACRPEPQELDQIEQEAVRVLVCYLSTLGACGPQSKIIAAQNQYSLEQRKNQHTKKALTNLLGDTEAEKFINDILFPIIK